MAELEIICKSLKRDMPDLEPRTKLRDIHFEIKRLLIIEERERAIKQLRTGTIFAASGLEILNNQFGQPFELNGFARATSVAATQQRKFDAVLHELYLKYWTRPMRSAGGGSDGEGGNAFLELAQALAISAATFHISKMDLAGLVMGTK